jgi:uncharacterized protein YhbP (UPF0306 family)
MNSDVSLKRRILSFLERHSTLTLATINQEGEPEAASLFFTEDAELNLYWLSSAKSRHSHNLRIAPKTAVTISSSTWKWTAIRGVQMEGKTIKLPPGPERDSAMKLYRRKFPFVNALVGEIAKASFYKFLPDWVRWVDNKLEFGHRHEIVLRCNVAQPRNS